MDVRIILCVLKRLFCVFDWQHAWETLSEQSYCVTWVNMTAVCFAHVTLKKCQITSFSFLLGM